MTLALALSWFGVFCLLHGHRDGSLSPVRHGVSTYAARGKRGGWIKTGLFLWAVSLLSAGIPVSLRAGGFSGWLVAAGSVLFSVGLLLVVLFDETVPEFHRLFAALPQAVYEQTYHNAGVQLNGLGSLLTLLSWAHLQGLFLPVSALFLASQGLRHTPWPGIFGIPFDESRGLRQRVEIALVFSAFQLLLLREVGLL